MVLPELLRDARGHLSDANVAASHVIAAYQSDQLHLCRQYISEWQHAVDMCSQAIEDWYLGIEIDEASQRLHKLREAKHAYDMALIEARDNENDPW